MYDRAYQKVRENYIFDYKKTGIKQNQVQNYFYNDHSLDTSGIPFDIFTLCRMSFYMYNSV